MGVYCFYSVASLSSVETECAAIGGRATFAKAASVGSKVRVVASQGTDVSLAAKGYQDSNAGEDNESTSGRSARGGRSWRTIGYCPFTLNWSR